MKKKIIILFLSLIFTSYLFSQVGINMESPTATLSIKSLSDKIPVVVSRNSDNKELAKLLDNGYLVMGGGDAVNKLDLRGISNGILGLGKTSITATEAGAGVIRYNDGIEYSDGSNWVRLTTVPVKAYVIAKNEVSLRIPQQSSSIWNNWTTVMDVTNSFDSKTGIFTAPRTGVYSVSCTGMGTVTTSAATVVLSVELILKGTNQSIKSGVAAPLSAKNTGKASNITFLNKAFVYLMKGNTVSFTIYNGMNNTLQTTTDGSYNTLMISEM